MLANLCLLVGVLLCLIAWVWSVVLAFRQSVWWLLGFLFVPFVSLVFQFKFWAQAKRPFLLRLAGLAAMLPALVGIVKNPVAAEAMAAALGKGTMPTFTMTSPPGAARAAAAPAAAGGETSAAGPRREVAPAETAERRAAVVAEKQTAYGKHRAEADALFAELNARRAKLKVDDVKLVAVFNADAARYGTLLELARGEKLALDELTFGANPPPPASAGPKPPEARSSKQAQSAKSEAKMSKL